MTSSAHPQPPPLEGHEVYGEIHRADAEILGALPMAKDYGSFDEGPARKRINTNALVLAVLIPSVIFTGLCALMTLAIHITHPGLAVVACLVALAFPVLFLLRYGQIRIMERAEGDPHEPTWLLFVAITSFLAVFLGFAMGMVNYKVNTEGYYDYEELAHYESVDPSATGGGAYMDAATIKFIDGSHLDLTRSMGFHNEHTYCVAPITVGDTPLASYDFWAVGIDCCSGFPGDFGCFDPLRYLSVRPVQSGRRWLRPDADRANFLVAVEQAQTQFGFISRHPLFLVWEQSPRAYILSYFDMGVKSCLAASIAF
eukprot:CAMPEP_0178415552 /NCGR_PEP_ID=MMETSP0689_2-20121128/23610_1 /TAXON_ID=160604 /ORGANISM="Amphidinium massartii, Strain CS-259" /LENGTH=312 /DNA_ID=CAMNT_0020036875 /DNA_START=31 /DNA_END=966 /DNA_ORIENTATION=-